MLLGNEINNLFSRLFASADAKSQDADNQRAARREYSVPLMQIVERQVSQRQKETGMAAVAPKAGFAAEVGPPPLTPAAMRR